MRGRQAEKEQEEMRVLYKYLNIISYVTLKFLLLAALIRMRKRKRDRNKEKY